MEITDLPFEYATRYGDLYRDLGLSMEQAAALEERDRQLEDYLAAFRQPLVFHWPGTVADHLNVRNGPGAFDRGGIIHKIVYRWDDDASGVASGTIVWEVGGSVVATHASDADGDTADGLQIAYDREVIVGTVTTINASASGLTAFVFLH